MGVAAGGGGGLERGRLEGSILRAAEFGSLDHHFREGMAAELALDVAAVDFHRATAKAEFFGDVARGEAAAHGGKNFTFAGGERGEAVGCLAGTFRRAGQQGGGSGAQVRATGQYCPQRGHQRFLGLVFHDEKLACVRVTRDLPYHDLPGGAVDGDETEAQALVRRASRLLVAGAALRVPLVAVILRRGYGLGAQAMTGGSLHEPLLTVAWPGAHLGPMGLEGAVRLGLRKELEAIADVEEREERVREATAAAQSNAKALNAAQLFEIDDVIDPAETRGLIAATLAAAESAPERPRHRFVDTW